MSKVTKSILLVLAALFFTMGTMSVYYAKPYEELTNIETKEGTVFKLHCPTNGAAALSLSDDTLTYNLTVKFDQEYCNDDNSQTLLGKQVALEAVRVSENYYQVYRLTSGDQVIVSPNDVEADQSSSTVGLFFLAFLLVALVIYKSRNKNS